MTLHERLIELRREKASAIDRAKALVAKAESEKRGLNEAEQTEFDAAKNEQTGLQTRIGVLEALIDAEAEQRSTPAGAGDGGKAPNVNMKTKRGDDEVRAMAHFIRTGDVGAVRGLPLVKEGNAVGIDLRVPTTVEMRAAVDSTINITTNADGKYAVPVGLANMIAARKHERMLAASLGLTNVPGKGTTVNFPYENADVNAFAATSEQADNGSTNNYERDAVVLGQKAFTLVKYTRKLHLTEEIEEDEDVSLLTFVADWIGRQMAQTHNTLLLTEVAANGTVLKTFAGSAAIAAGEPEDIVFNNTLSYYLDDASSAAWVMRPASFGDIASITGNSRLYAEDPAGSRPSRSLLGYPVLFSNNASAIGGGNKSVYFGDWSRVGYRESAEVRLVMDPYSIDGVVAWKYSFRAVYGVLVAGAIGYGAHPTA